MTVISIGLGVFLGLVAFEGLVHGINYWLTRRAINKMQKLARMNYNA